MKSKLGIFLSIGTLAFVGFVASRYVRPILTTHGNSSFENIEQSMPATPTSSTSRRSSSKPGKPKPEVVVAGQKFAEGFDSAFTVVEDGNLSGGNNPNWWVSSGAYLYSKDGEGSTILGSLPALDPWRVAFSLSNSLDTDNGYHPQNIFRLVLKSMWKNLEQKAYFKIANNNLSESPNRNTSNGLLFFNRYQDEYNLYYAGIRVDGYAVIKKKINGAYYTMAYKPFYLGNPYDRTSNPNLIPQNQWIGLKSEVKTNTDGTVSIKLYVDKDKSGNWVLAAEAKDDGKSYGGNAFLNAGNAGLRTDFMDVSFDDYFILEI